MLLGLALDAWSGADVKLPVERVQLAERLGYDSVWTAEAYGADALTPLAYLAASTDADQARDRRRADLGAHARPRPRWRSRPSNRSPGRGRVIAGLGLSGPQIVEGWYGQPWAKPIARTRDYVAIMRKVFRREGPVAHDGPRDHLPYAGADATGLGKPLRSILHPNPALPIYLAAGGPENVALAAEVADGWIPMGLSPANAPSSAPRWRRARRARAATLDTLAIHASTTVHLTDDVAGTIARDEAARRVVRRRDGRARQELPQGRDGAPRLRGRGRTDPGAVPRGPARRRDRTRCPTSTSTRARCSAPPTASRSASSRGPSAASPA